jgi:hypothetical protein
VAPTDSLPVVRYDVKVGQRSLDMLRCGLIPYWAKDSKVGFANINAKAEGIESEPAFHKAFERRRCLVPVDNFYGVAQDRGREAALCARPGRSRHHAARGLVGELEVTERGSKTAGTGLTKWTSSAPWTLGIHPYVHPGRTRCMRHGLPHARRIGRGMLLLLLPLRAFGNGRTGKFVDRAVAAGCCSISRRSSVSI